MKKVYILKYFDDILYVGSSLKAVREYAKKIDDPEILESTCIAEFTVDSENVKFHSTVEKRRKKEKIMKNNKRWI